MNRTHHIHGIDHVRGATSGAFGVVSKEVGLYDGLRPGARLVLSALALVLVGLLGAPVWADGSSGGGGGGGGGVGGGGGGGGGSVATGLAGSENGSNGSGFADGGGGGGVNLMTGRVGGGGDGTTTGGGGGGGGGYGLGGSSLLGGSGGGVGVFIGAMGGAGDGHGGGGAGGAGGTGDGVTSAGGGGGAGGGGLLMNVGIYVYGNTGDLTGGDGGAGGTNNPYFDPSIGIGGGGGGGAGGAGVAVIGGWFLDNLGLGRIIGGNGGVGGIGGVDGSGGSGGAGGIGVAAMGGGDLTNYGTITGGDGGEGGSGNGGAGAGGAGGVGVIGSGINLVNSGAITGGMSGDGATRADAIQLTGGTNTLTLNPGSTLTGGIGLSNGASLAFNQATNASLSDPITGMGSLIQSGTGMLVLNGVNTYTGGTTVSDGTLEVGDAANPGASIAGNVQVNSPGVLRGHGTVSGDVNNNGTVRPGGSIGTLTINGNYTQSPLSTLMIDVSPTTASQLKVGGTASLNGTLSLLYGPGTYTTTTYRIIDAGAVTGGFATVTGNTPSGIAQSVLIGANAVDLALVGAGSVVVDPTNATLFGAMGSAALREGVRVNDTLLDRLSGPCHSPDDQICMQPGRNVWIQASGTDTRIDGKNGAPDVRDQRYGFMAGTDRQWKGWTVGLATGYSHSDVKEDHTGARGVLDTLRLAGYAGRSVGPVNLAGTVGYAYDMLSSTRQFGPLGSAKGSGHGQEFNAGIQASAPWQLGGMILTPRLGVRYTHLDGLGLNETGPTSQNLGVASQSQDSLQPYVGATLDYPLNLASKRPASLQARVGYAYETQSTGRNVVVTAADGTGFVIAGTSESRGLLTAGLGATLPMGKAAQLYARYDATLHTGNVSAQSLQAGVSYRF